MGEAVVEQDGPEVHVLGPLELRVNGLPVDLSRQKVRQLLVRLAVTPELPVSGDALIEHLWSEKLPKDPAANLRVVVSRLRAALGDRANALESDQQGYCLRAVTDWQAFQAALSVARASTDVSRRIEVLSDALDGWRGHAFGDHRSDPAVRSLAGQLEDQRREAAVLLGESLLADGRAVEAISTVRALYSTDCDDERLCAVLAAALATEGRKSEALGVLAALRDLSRARHGLDLSDAITELEAEILGGAVDLRPRPSVASPQSRPSVVVGRDDALRSLHANSDGISVIVGRPGVGKSTLVGRLVADLEAGGRVVVQTSTSPNPDHPMQPIVALCRGLLDDVKEPAQPELASALARLDGSTGAGPEGPTLTRHQLIDTLVGYIEDAVDAARALLILDDIQWLDRASAEALELLAERGRCPMVLCSRPDVPAYVEPLVHAEATGTTRFDLGPLDRARVEEIIADGLSPTTAAELSASFYERSGGNPLFLSLLVQLAAEGALQTEDLPATVLVAVQARLNVLSDRARRTLQVGAAFMNGFSVDDLTQLRSSTVDDVDEACRAGLLVVDGEVGRYRFVHQLVAEGAYQMLSEGQRVDLHDEIGRLLEDRGEPAATYALHASQAAAFDPHRAVIAHRDAARSFAGAYGWDTAQLHADHALECVGNFEVSDDEARCELLLLKGTAMRAMGAPGSEQYLVEAADLASTTGLSEVQAHALIELASEGRMGSADALGARLVVLLDEALEADLEPRLAAELSAVGSTLFAISDHDGRASELFRAGFKMCQELDDEALEARVLSRMNLSLPHPDDFPLRRQSAKRLLELAKRDNSLRFDANVMELNVCMVAGDGDGAAAAMAQLRDLAGDRQSRNIDGAITRSESAYTKFIGDLERAEKFANRLLADETSMTTSSHWRFITYAGLIVAIRQAQGRLAELLPVAERLVASNPSVISWRLMEVACTAATGDLDSTAEKLDRVLPHRFGHLTHDVAWWAGLSIMTDAIVAVDNPEAARTAFELLKQQSGRMIWNGAAVQRSADEQLAKLAGLLGDDAAVAHHQALAEDVVRAVHSAWASSD